MVARCGHMVKALDGVGAERNGHDSGVFNEMRWDELSRTVQHLGTSLRNQAH